MWLVRFIMKQSASSELHTQLMSKQKSRTIATSIEKTTTLTTYPQVVYYLLRLYVTDETLQIPKVK